jgi:hypothetical protein
MQKDTGFNSTQPTAETTLLKTQHNVAATALKDAQSLNDLIFDMSNNAHTYNREVTLETGDVKNYATDKSRDNLILLQSKDRHLAKVYQDILGEGERRRHLSCVKIVDDNIKNNAHFNSIGADSHHATPEVHFNLQNIETYTEPALEFVLEQIAIKVGAKTEDVLNNKKLVSTFIFLHEFGHADDYIHNSLRSSAEKPGLARHQIINDAVRNDRKSRLRDMMTLPVPGNIKITSQAEFNKFIPRMKSMGINNMREYQYAKQRAYREMPSEKYADDFATKYILDHYDDYFLKPGEVNNKSSRIKTGELVEMGDNFAEHLGLKEGKYLSLEKIWPTNPDQSVPYGHRQQGFLTHNVALGKKIELGDGNADHSYDLFTTPVEKIKRRVVKTPDGRYENQIYIATASGSVYKAQVDSSKSAPVVEYSDTAELNRTLNLSVGSEVQLLKRKINHGGRSNLDEGAFLSGKLTREIVIGHGIRLDDGSQTMYVEKVARRWKTWLVKTSSNSIYEILPVADFSKR